MRLKALRAILIHSANSSGIPRDISNAAGYHKGQELLLLLHAANQNGLSSPVGLGQGRFRIVRDKTGNATANNAYNNVGLLRGLSAAPRAKSLSHAAQQAISAPAESALSLDLLKEILHSYGASQ